MAKQKDLFLTKTVTVEDAGRNNDGSWFQGEGNHRGRVLKKLTRKVCAVLEKELPNEIDIHTVSISVHRAERLVHEHGRDRMKPTLLGTATVTYSQWWAKG